jgi:two-component system, LytTR family, sensor kinase
MQQARPIIAKTRERLWIASIWLVIAVFNATQTVFVMHAEGMRHAWVALYFTQLLSWIPWFAATPLVRYLGHRYPIRLKDLTRVLVHFSACMAINLIAAAWHSGFEELLNPWARVLRPEPFLPLWLDQFYNGLLVSLFLYAAILSLSSLVESRERLANQEVETARLSEQLAKAQLESLRRQIEPHFLFNSLHAIAGLIRESRSEDAVNTIASLSEFLRLVIEHPDRQEAPLGQEVRFVQKYLDIQKLRFAERLKISVNVPDELFCIQVPSLVLQPLVENAVKHGIDKRVHGGWIRVAAFRANGWLTLRVYNDGPDLPEGLGATTSGVGIANMRARLQGLYGDRFAFSLQNQSFGVEALLSVPFREG